MFNEIFQNYILDKTRFYLMDTHSKRVSPSKSKFRKFDQKILHSLPYMAKITKLKIILKREILLIAEKLNLMLMLTFKNSMCDDM